MTGRDRVVCWALGSGALVAVLAWHFLGPWASLVAVLLALGAATLAYRLEGPHIDVEHPDGWRAGSADRDDAARVDQ